MPYPATMAPRGQTDAELVGETLAGKRDAFAEIVHRHQALVCSLAYSATGDLARSEDLAQETFLTVWRQLAELREPEKLRAWICGIARHRIQDSFRSHYREPGFMAETLDSADDAPAPEAQPSDQAARADETAIMWRALQQIPEIYREPLILFHREDQSVERVAAKLDLSEDTVKQRLVRGRKLLQTEVGETVERTLQRTAPGRAFTAGVIEALPAFAAAAKGVTPLATATAVAKSSIGGGAFSMVSTIMASPLMPIAVVYVARRLRLVQEERSATAEVRELRKSARREFTFGVLLAAACLLLWGEWIKRVPQPLWYHPLGGLVAIAALLILWAHAERTSWCIREVWARTRTTPAQTNWEYRSRQTLLGLPLLHIRLHATNTPVRAWIAVGNFAYGVIFACGRVAIAPLSLGLFGVGLVGVGGLMAGVLTFGLQSIGVLAAGAFAGGWMAKGVIAYGTHAAYGLEAFARDFAGCPSGHARWTAHALHANDGAAREFFDHSAFFSWTSISEPGFRLMLTTLTVLCLVGFVAEISWKYRRLRQCPR